MHAQPKPCNRRKKKREYEKDKKESRSRIQSQGGYSCTIKGDKPLAELAEQLDVFPNQISEWKQQLQKSEIDVFGSNSRAKAAEPDFKIFHWATHVGD